MSKPTFFKLNRDLVVASTLGASVEFVKGEPTFVPPQMHKQVIDLGAEVTDGEADETDHDSTTTGKPKTKPERVTAMNEAFEKIALASDKTKFDGNGVPTIVAMRAELGWAVDAKERDDAWNKFKAGKD